jgi:hypothetical protein
MNRKQYTKLTHELTAAGAATHELTELAMIASNLGGLQHTDIPTVVPTNTSHHKKIRMTLTVGVPALLGLVVGMFLVAAVQNVLPGNPLYPIQAASDSVAASIDPSYRGTLMMKRATQVKELVNNHAPSQEVYATLADYKTQAASYKSVAANYAAFEYCKDNLQQATSKATSGERQAIDKTLAALADV